MKNIRIYLLSFLCFFSANLFAQNDCLDDCTDMLGLPRKEVYLPDTLRYLVMGDTTKRAKETTNKRVVYFVHGIGGSEASWGRAATAAELGDNKSETSRFPAFNIKSLQPDYANAQSSMDDAARNVFTYMESIGKGFSDENNITDRTQNFVIAHSMGGLVTRNIIQHPNLMKNQPLNEKDFGGLVTFGTPHQGAKLAENIMTIDENGKYEKSRNLNQFTIESAAALIDGPLREGVNKLPIVKYFSGFIDFDNLKAKISQKVPTILTVATPFEDELFKPIAAELRPISPFIQNLNANPDNTIPKMAFYGTEEPSIFWRCAASFLGVDNINSFQSGDDKALMDDANDNKNTYQAKATEWNYKMNLFQSLGGIDKELKKCKWYEAALGICYIKSAANTLLDFQKARDMRDAWQRGVNWYINIDNDYQMLTGSRGIIYSTTSECTCLDESGIPIPCDQAQVPIFQDKYCGYEYIQYQDTYYHSNDGVVISESAMNLPNATRLPIEMIGSNHFQMRNDQNTRFHLEQILKGKYITYFTCGER